MSISGKKQKVHVDFERAAEVLPYLEKDLAALDKALDSYQKNFARFSTKFLSLFHNPDSPSPPNPEHPLNRAAEHLELSHLIQLKNQIATDDIQKLTRPLEQANERMRTASGLINAYLKHF